MIEVTDPAILAQLNGQQAPSNGLKEVTDPAILAQLNGQQAPSQTTPTQSQPNQNLLGQIANSAPVNAINAFGGGAQQTLANAIKYGSGLVGDVTNSPGITEAGKTISDKLQPPEFIKQIQEENPKTSLAGNIAGGAMAMGGVGLATAATLPEATQIYATNAIIGAATAGPGAANRAIGGFTGLATTKAFNMVGYALSKVSAAASVPDKLKAVVSEANSALRGQTSDEAAQTSISNMWNMATKVRDALYDKFKTAPGLVNAKTLSNQAKQFTEQLEDVMTPGQKGAFQVIQKQANNITNLNDLHELNKSISDMKSLFEKSGTAPNVVSAFKDLKDTSENLLTSHAEKLGVGSDLDIARKFNAKVISPLQEFGADKIAKGEVSTDGFLSKYIKTPSNTNPEGSPVALGKLLNAMDSNGREVITNSLIKRIAQSTNVGADGMDATKGIKMIDDNINLYGKQLGPDAVNKLQGMKKLLQASVIKPSSAAKAAGSFVKTAALPIAGAAIGSGHGYSQGGAGQAVIEGVAGLAGTALLEKMIGSTVGQAALKFMGQHESGAAMAKSFVSHFASAGLGNLEDKLSY